MTSTPVGGVGRSPGEPVRPLSALALSPAIVVLLLAGLALRLLIAYVLFPGSGFESDLSSYASWASSMAEYGPAGFYANAGFADYPPAYLYVLWLVGTLSGAAVSATELIKLPPILLDVLVGFVIYRLVRGWTWPSPRSEALALAAAALYVFNPVSFYDSALWGQTDAAGALVILLGLAALIRGNSEGAAAFAATAALVKPQFGVVLIPIVAAVLIKRHLLRSGSGPRQAPWAPRRAGGLAERASGAHPAADRVRGGLGRLLPHRPALRHGAARVPRAHVRHGRWLRLPQRQRLQRLGPGGRGGRALAGRGPALE